MHFVYLLYYICQCMIYSTFILQSKYFYWWLLELIGIFFISLYVVVFSYSLSIMGYCLHFAFLLCVWDIEYA